MSEEEKEAIKNVEKFVYSIFNGIGANDCKILLNLIDKLQKELEQERESHKSTSYNFELVVDKLDNSISKDKIRDKIKELEGQEDWYIENKNLDELYGMIDILNELLEEE